MEIETTKGNFSGNFEECVAWLEEYQPSHASLVDKYQSAVLNTSIDWLDAMRLALIEIDKNCLS